MIQNILYEYSLAQVLGEWDHRIKVSWMALMQSLYTRDVQNRLE